MPAQLHSLLYRAVMTGVRGSVYTRLGKYQPPIQLLCHAHTTYIGQFPLDVRDDAPLRILVVHIHSCLSLSSSPQSLVPVLPVCPPH